MNPKVDLHSNNTDLSTKKESSLNICIFSHSSQLGGSERSLLELAKELVRDYGAACCVVVPSDGPLVNKLIDVGVGVCVIRYSWWCNSVPPSKQDIKGQLNDSFANCLSAIREISKINPDIILTNTLVIPWGAIVASLIKKPHIWYVSEFGERDHGLKFYRSFSEILRIIEGSSNVILTNSDSVRLTLFGSSSHTPVETVYRYIDPVYIGADDDKRKYFKRENSIKLALIGTITESKGQHTAILAVNLLKKKNLDAELVIVGSCPSKEYLNKLQQIIKKKGLSESVQLQDFEENIFPLLKQSDVALVCSKMEAFGRITVEAMYLKKPVIGTNSGCTIELIRDQENGLLFGAENHEMLASKIEFLMTHKEKISEYGERGYAFVQKTLSVERYGGRVYAIAQALKGKNNLAFSSQEYSGFLAEIMTSIAKDYLTPRDELVELRRKTSSIESSAGWKLLLKYYAFRDLLLPVNSRRRKLIRGLSKALRRI